MENQIASIEYTEILSDVVTRFKAHDSCKSKEDALKALISRTEGISRADNSNNLEEAISVYDKIVELITSGNYIDTSNNKTGLSSPDDIQFDSYLKEVKNCFPKSDDKLIIVFINWVIFWHYLK